MRQDLLVADNIHLPWNEAFYHCLSLSFLICYQSLEGKAIPMGDTFFAKMFIRTWFLSKTLCLLYCMLPACKVELIVYRPSSIGFNFPLLFGFNVIFPHIFTVLHIITAWRQAGSRLICRIVFLQKRNSRNLAFTGGPIFPSPNLRRAHLRSQKLLENI